MTDWKLIRVHRYYWKTPEDNLVSGGKDRPTLSRRGWFRIGPTASRRGRFRIGLTVSRRGWFRIGPTVSRRE
jgi:hypothetical protein